MLVDFQGKEGACFLYRAVECASSILVFAHSFRGMISLDTSPGAELYGYEPLGGCHFEKERRGTGLSMAVEEEEGKNEKRKEAWRKV